MINNYLSDDWESLLNQISSKSSEKGNAIKVSFELTPQCNLECEMCYVRLNKPQMDNIGRLLTADEWISLAEAAANQGTLLLLLTGGEPLLHPEFKKIYKSISQMGFLIELYTNALQLDGEILNLLKENPPSHISITLYGASDETYKNLCGKENVFDRIIDNIKTLKSTLHDIPILVRTTFVKQNINDFDKIRELMKELEIDYKYAFGTLKPVRGASRENIENVRLSYDEIINFHKQRNSKYEDENIAKNDSDTYNKMRCRAAKSAYTISWDGKMLPCLIFNSPYTEPLKEGVENAWRRLKTYRNEMIIPDRCIKCKYKNYCGKCPAYIQSESGTYKDNEPYNCNYKNIYLGSEHNEKVEI